MSNFTCNDNSICTTNLSADQIKDLCTQEGQQSNIGVNTYTTGSRTGRSPKDRFIIQDDTTRDTVSWGNVNQPMQTDHFNRLWDKALDHMAHRQHYYCDLTVGASEQHNLTVRTVSELAWHQQFVHHMFIERDDVNYDDNSWTILNAASLQLDPTTDNTNSDGVVAIDFTQHRILICGIRYAGEMKKGMFSVMNYLLTEHDILPMHCAANLGNDGKTALFFGLSGTGKTTLSADPDRALIGDDEHGWGNDDEGVFNIEGGCYAKAINITQKTEPVIWDAIRDTAVMENVVLKDDGTPDYFDNSLTDNTRVAYPRTHIDLRVDANKGPQPSAVIFLCCDMYGVLPPVAKLNREQAAFYFMSGYTAAVGSTEVGSTAAIKPTFSACFGAPFFPRPISVYTDLLMKKLDDTNCPVYLVNTGWTGGAYGKGGERFKLPVTRRIVTAITNGEIEQGEFTTMPGFNFQIPTHLDGVSDAVLNPVENWSDKSAYQDATTQLIEQFQDNLNLFKNIRDAVRQAAPAIETTTV